MTKEDYEERDQLFCELLFETGSISQASEAVGVSIRTGRKIAERRKEMILSMTNSELSALAYKAVSTMGKSLDADGSVPKEDVRLKAAGDILDRIGASKKVTSEVEVKADTPVILMPAKDPVVIPSIKISTEQEN